MHSRRGKRLPPAVEGTRQSLTGQEETWQRALLFISSSYSGDDDRPTRSHTTQHETMLDFFCLFVGVSSLNRPKPFGYFSKIATKQSMISDIKHDDLC